MAGPFLQYTEPGTYTRTLADTTISTLTGTLRIPLFIGVGSETLSLSDYEIVRGSSSQVDNVMQNEDVSSQFDGTSRTIQVSKYPIVNGDGSGTVTYNPNDVKVTINDQPTGVAVLEGNVGRIILSVYPRETDVVKVNYYFKRTDTLVGGSAEFPAWDNLSEQANGTNKVFKVSHVPVVIGNNGGVPTTDITKVSVTVDGVIAEVTELDGQGGAFTLRNAPAADAVVLAQYYTNKWQDTYDYLPVSNITNVVRCGTAAGRNDFINTLDFVIEDNKIMWGNSFSTKEGVVYPAPAAPFSPSLINAYKRDNKVYMRPAVGVVDGVNKIFTLEYFPTDGSGEGTVTDDPALLHAYVGYGATVADAVADAKSRDASPATAAVVSAVWGNRAEIELKVAPAIGELVFVTYYHNMMADDTFTFTCLTASTPTIEGTYKVTSLNNGKVLSAVEDAIDTYVANPQYAIDGIINPPGGPDCQVMPGYTQEEVVLAYFLNSRDYLVMSSIGPDGSNGSGTLDQTYIDTKTGLRFTLMSHPLMSNYYAADDQIEFDITETFTTSVVPTRSIPGIQTTINSLLNVATNSTATMTTYNKSGNEPAVGDFYYLSVDYAKTEYPIKVYTKIKDVTSEIGAVNVDNRLSLAAQLAFSNGAIAIALAQVLRDNSGIDASVQAYNEVLSLVESPIKGYGIKPSIICPITTKQEVINTIRLHCEKMSSIRYRSERTGIFGFAVGTTPEQAQQFARNMKSERMLGLYPDGAIIGMLDELGNVHEALVDGSFLAAAFTGLAVNPIYDVATPLTHKTLTGFRRLIRQVDVVTMNQTATAGLTILEDLVPNLLVRHAMTTDPTNVLTREPTVIYIKDYVQQQMRATLDPYIGIKFLPTVIQDVETSIDSLMNQLVNQEIITAFQGTSATQDPNDPTILNCETFYSPVFPLNWIVMTFNLRVKI